MKHRNIITKTISLLAYCLILILFGHTAIAQTTIWSEDFESYADGDTLAVNNNTVNPDIDWSFGAGSSVNKVFATNPISGFLSFYHRQGISTWTTESIDISSYSNVSISISINEATCETGDKIETFYNIDAAGPVEFGDGNGDGAFTNASNTIDSLNGSILIITIVTTSDAIDDKHKFDNILVQGTLSSQNELNNSINKNIIVYPNPFSGKFKIDSDRIENVEIFNMAGKLVYNGKESEIDLSSEPKGIYILELRTISGVIVEKLLLE